MHHDERSTHHGDGSMLHGERSMHHGDGSMLHIERSMHHSDGSYSAAVYACHVWARSTQAHKLNPAIHLLAGIAPPHIKRTVACRMERTRQTTDAIYQLFHHQPAASRLKSRMSFMHTVTPLNSSASSSRLRLWKNILTDVPASVKMGLDVAESLPAGSGEDWLCWRALSRLRTGVGRAKNSDVEMGLSR